MASGVTVGPSSPSTPLPGTGSDPKSHQGCYGGDGKWRGRAWGDDVAREGLGLTQPHCAAPVADLRFSRWVRPDAEGGGAGDQDPEVTLGGLHGGGGGGVGGVTKGVGWVMMSPPWVGHTHRAHLLCLGLCVGRL